MKIGIDLGTTRSAVGIVEAENPELLPNNAGDRLTPSVVYFGEEDEVLVGKQAISKEKADPDRVVRNAKRKMGTDHEFSIGDRDPTPVDVSADVLKKLKSDAENYTDEEITGAHITVPAYFTVDQKSDTREAAEQAGFDEIDLLHEPTAAAISHGFNRDHKETVFVYDFGGGTLDISVMDIEGNSFQMRATAGDTNLGGDDFTQRLVDLLSEEVLQDKGVDPRNDSEVHGNVREIAEEAKINLSGRKKTEVNAALIGMVDGEPIGITERVIQRSEFENEVSDLLDRSMDPIDEALSKAQIGVEDVDTVLLVGGSSQIPAVKDRLEDKFGFAPTQTSDLDWAVAQGAAIVSDLDDTEAPVDGFVCPACSMEFDLHGKLREHIAEVHDSNDSNTYECTEPECEKIFDDQDERDRHVSAQHDITGTGSGIDKSKILGRSLGTDLDGGRMDILISHDKAIPESDDKVVEATARYTTSNPNQTKIPVHVYQGENVEHLSKNEKLSDWYVTGIPELPAGEPIIEVTFSIDKDSTLSVSAELIKPKESELDDDQLGTIDVEGGQTPGQPDSSKEQAAGDD